MLKKNTKLSEQEINQLTKLEQMFHNRYLSPEFLHQLISIYVKAIEAFSSEFKGMKSYFMNKMQFVLCQPQINRLLEGEGSINESIRETIRITERTNQEKQEIVPLIIKEEVNFNKQKKQQDRFQQVYKARSDQHKNQQQPKAAHHYHYDENKSNQIGAKIDKKIKFMREYEENMKNAKQQVQQADKKLQKNLQKVINITKDQQNSLNERLAKRKKKQRRKSIDVKAEVFKMDGEQNAPPPVVRVQELKEAQRQLTTAILKYTIRMTQKQREGDKERGDMRGGRVKKARNLEQSQILKEQQEQHQQQQEQKEESRKRIKTTRRQIEDD